MQLVLLEPVLELGCYCYQMNKQLPRHQLNQEPIN
jgi:hypothetical protein